MLNFIMFIQENSHEKVCKITLTTGAEVNVFRLLQYNHVPSLKYILIQYDIAKPNNAFLSKTLTWDKILKEHLQLNAVPSQQAT